MTAAEYFSDWAKVVDVREADRIIRSLAEKRVPVCPLIKDVFRAFRLCPYRDLKVVIIGQDPYPQTVKGRPVAQGVAFANNAATAKDSLSPSLRVLMESVIDFSVPHGRITFAPDLEKWERQGVLLLNSALTCEAGRPGSHTLLWRPFMVSFLERMQLCKTGIIYILMGSQAQSFEPYIDSDYNYMFRTPHPAVCARSGTKFPHELWQSVNTILVSNLGYGIQWYDEERFS